MIRLAITVAVFFVLVTGTAQAGEFIVNTIKDRHGITPTRIL